MVRDLYILLDEKARFPHESRFINALQKLLSAVVGFFIRFDLFIRLIPKFE